MGARAICAVLGLSVGALGQIKQDTSAQPDWCGWPRRRLASPKGDLNETRRRVLKYDTKHMTSAVTNRSTLVEDNMVYRSLPDPLEALAMVTLHTHKLRHNITYFELGCGEGHMLLELKAIFPCIHAIGLNAAWHCDQIGGLDCTNGREDILDAARFFGVDGIHEHNMPRVVLGDAREGFPFLENSSVDLFVSFNAFHYVLPDSGKAAVFNDLTRVLKPHGMVVMMWNWALTFDDLVASDKYNIKPMADAPDAVVLKGVQGYFQGVMTRAVLLIAQTAPGIQLWLCRGDLYAEAGHGPKYLGVPESFFSVPERRDIAEAVSRDHAGTPKESKKDWARLDAVFGWMDLMVSEGGPKSAK